MSGCIAIAQLDMFDLQDFFSSNFDFKETTALNDNFIFMGMDNKNFLINSGSYFLFVFGTVIWFLFKFLLNMVAVKFSRF